MIAAAKRADKEKVEILRLGKGNMDRGVEAFNKRMRKDKERKAEKDALEMSQDAVITAEFWKWRLQTDMGKCYGQPVHPATLKTLKMHTFINESKITSISTKYAKEALQYLLEADYTSRFNITFAPDSQGKVHLYSIVHKADNPNHHITMAPLTTMHFEGIRKKPEEISGPITHYQINNGKFYIRTNTTTMTNAHFLLPEKWQKFKKSTTLIGGKTVYAQPTTGPHSSLASRYPRLKSH